VYWGLLKAIKVSTGMRQFDVAIERDEEGVRGLLPRRLFYRF
jgi:hypothetical protein